MYLAALIAYYGFLSLFPLLLLLVTILGFVLQNDAQLQEQLLDSALAQFPVIGSQLRDNVRSLTGRAPGSRSASCSRSTAAWAWPARRRTRSTARGPCRATGARTRSRRACAACCCCPSWALGIVVTTGLAGLTTSANAYGADLGAALRVLAILLAVVANIGLFMIIFRVLTASQVPTRDLRIGAIAAGVGWQAVQVLGTYFVTNMLRGRSEAYGVFGLVLGLIAWIYLLALVLVLAAEINVVAQRRLWPRALLTPFTDDVQLTAADERAYTGYAGSEQHKGFEVIDVEFALPEKTPTSDE